MRVTPNDVTNSAFAIVLHEQGQLLRANATTAESKAQRAESATKDREQRNFQSVLDRETRAQSKVKKHEAAVEAMREERDGELAQKKLHAIEKEVAMAKLLDARAVQAATQLQSALAKKDASFEQRHRVLLASRGVPKKKREPSVAVPFVDAETDALPSSVSFIFGTPGQGGATTNAHRPSLLRGLRNYKSEHFSLEEQLGMAENQHDLAIAEERRAEASVIRRRKTVQLEILHSLMHHDRASRLASTAGTAQQVSQRGSFSGTLHVLPTRLSRAAQTAKDVAIAARLKNLQRKRARSPRKFTLTN